jgi:hypothetical protein
MRTLVLLAALALPAAASPDTGGAQCLSDSTCPYECCRKKGPNFPCYCSHCCTAKGAGAAEIYWSGDRVAALFSDRIEFYRLPAGVTAVVASSAAVRALHEMPLPRGRLEFRRGPAAARLKPVRTAAFKNGLLPPGHASGARSAIAACSKPPSGACRVYALDGRTLFTVSASLAPGESLEPAGLAEDGSESLFALIRTAPRREIAGYVVRGRDGVERSLPAEAPETRALLERFEGPAIFEGP